MADDIKIVVQVVGDKDIVKTTKSLERMELGVRKLSKDLDKGRISGDQYDTGLKELRRTVDSSFSSWQKAKGAVDKYSKSVLQASAAAKQAKIDQEVAKVSASYDRLKASIDPVFAAQQRMKKAHAEIRAALKAEVITRDEAVASLRQYRTALKNGQVAGQALNKGMNRSGVLAQQAGYQFGDFAVQVQSGTNFMVAAGQQATQLIGTFSMLAKTNKGIMAFSALGVLVPVITGLAAAFMRVKDSSKEASDGIQDSFSKLPEFFNSLGVEISKSFDKAFAEVESKYGKMFARLARIKLEETKSSIGQSFKETVPQTVEPSFIEKLGASLAQGMVGGDTKALGNIQAQTEALFAQSLAVQEIQKAYLKSVNAAKTFEDILALTKDTEEKLAAVSQESADVFVKQAEKLGLIRAEVASKTLSDDKLIDEARKTSENERLLGEQMIAQVREKALDQFKKDVAAESATLDAMFQNRTLFYSVRFAGEETVMGQSLTPSPMKPKQSYEELLAMGVSPEALLGMGLKPKKKSTQSGGPKTDPLEGKFQQIEKFLATERELVNMEYENRQLTLEQSLQKGYLTKETYAEMELELERRKQAELGEIEGKTQKAKVSAIAGGIADVLRAGANGNEKMLKMARTVGAAEALINTYRAAAQTLANPELPFYAKFAAVAATVAAGLSLVSSIKSGSSGASGSGAAATMPAQAAAATPQRVIIEGIDRNSLFSGEQLSNIFEAIYEENKNRGTVFEVAR